MSNGLQIGWLLPGLLAAAACPSGGSTTNPATAALSWLPTDLTLTTQPPVSASATVTLSNEGAALANVTSIAISQATRPLFSASPSSLTVAPGAQATVTVTYQPATCGATQDTAQLTLTSDAPNAPSFSVALTGVCATGGASSGGGSSSGSSSGGSSPGGSSVGGSSSGAGSWSGGSSSGGSSSGSSSGGVSSSSSFGGSSSGGLGDGGCNLTCSPPCSPGLTCFVDYGCTGTFCLICGEDKDVCCNGTTCNAGLFCEPYSDYTCCAIQSCTDVGKPCQQGSECCTGVCSTDGGLGMTCQCLPTGANVGTVDFLNHPYLCCSGGASGNYCEDTCD